MNILDRFYRNIRKQKNIVIVSGLPRSGTSMMMKMLEVGGIPMLTDHQRVADEDNPKGYYEFERAKKLKEGDTSWLPDAQGKVVKVISALLEYLPGEYRYQVIFMRRAVPEILASQRKMLVHRGEDPEKVSDAELGTLFEGHLQKVETWLEAQSNFDVKYVNYNQLLKNTAPGVREVNAFLGGNLDVEAMISVIDPHLYRQRDSNA